MIILDAINEHDKPIEMRKAVEDLLRKTRSRLVKLVITCRDSYWGVQGTVLGRRDCQCPADIEPDEAQQRAACAEIERLIELGAAAKYGIGVPQCFLVNASEGCLAGVAYVAIDPWGRLHPCVHSPSIIGSLHNHSLADLWQSPAMEAWRGLMPNECRGCAAYNVCHGGCRAVQELRPDHRDPLHRSALASFSPHMGTRDLPADGRPVLQGAVRPESFGYVILGQGQLLPVRTEAQPLLVACDGTLTFSALAERFGQLGLELLGDLWELGLLQIA